MPDLRSPFSGNFTIGNLWMNIWQLSWPMFIMMILNFLMGLADVYVAGFIGPEIQAAVGFVSHLYFLIIILANAISIGTLALVSRATGAGSHEEAILYARQSLIFGAVVAFALTVLTLAFSHPIIAFSGFPPGITGFSQNFLSVYALALGFNYLLIISNAIFRAAGEVKKPLFTMLVVTIIDIGGNFLLVFGPYPFPKMGYIGIAVASATSVAIGTLVNLTFFLSGHWKAIYKSPWGISGNKVKSIVKVGWPAAFLQVAWNAGTLVLYNILSRLENNIVAIAALTNGLRIEAFIYLPAFALNMAASVLVGQNMGAGNPDRATRLGWKIATSGAILISVMALLVFAGAEYFAIYLSGDPDVQAETARYLKITMLSEPLMAFSVILGGALQGAGDTRGTMWIIIVAMWLVRLPLSYTFASLFGSGAVGVWLAMITSMNIQGLLMIWRFRKGRWKGLKLE